MSLMDSASNFNEALLQAEIDSETTVNVIGSISNVHPPVAKFQEHTAYIAFSVTDKIIEKCPALINKEDILASAIRIVPRPSSMNVVINTTETLATILTKSIVDLDIYAEDGVTFKIKLSESDRTGSGARTVEGQFVIIHVGAESTTPLTTIRRIVTTEAGKVGIILGDKWNQMQNIEKTHKTGRFSVNITLASHFLPRNIQGLSNIKVAQDDVVHLQLSKTLSEEQRLCKRCLMEACFYNSKNGVMLCASKSSATDVEKKRARDSFLARAKRAKSQGSASGATPAP